MKKRTVFIFSLVFAVCANADQMSNLVERISKLEKRIAVLENECGIEKEKTPEEIAKKKAEEEKRIAQGKEIDAKIDAFLKEYFGVCVGDEISTLTNRLSKGHMGNKKIKPLKPYGQFGNAVCYYADGKLYGVCMYADFEEKYSKDSVDEQVDKTLSELCKSFGLPSDAHKRLYLGVVKSRYFVHRREGRDAISVAGSRNGFRRYAIDIEDNDSMKKFFGEERKRENSAGEKYPVSK